MVTAMVGMHDENDGSQAQREFTSITRKQLHAILLFGSSVTFLCLLLRRSFVVI